MQASYNQNKDRVTSIKYFREGQSKTYGSHLVGFKEWSFNATSELIGAHGWTSGLGIHQLGFITIDRELKYCPGEEPKVEPLNKTIETTPSALTDLEKQHGNKVWNKIDLGIAAEKVPEVDNSMLISALVGAIIVVSLLIVCLCCYKCCRCCTCDCANCCLSLSRSR